MKRRELVKKVEELGCIPVRRGAVRHKVSRRPHIDRADYALLNAVALDDWIAYLLAGEEMEAVMNAPSHGLNEHALADHFFRLWDLGLIECTYEDFDSLVPPDIALARRQFVRTQNWPPGDEALGYRLTSFGGEVWEYYSSPNWDKFYLRGTSSEPNECGLAASSRRTVELLLACPHDHPPPIAGTESWAVLQPWEATYWKTLPIGYQVTFRFATQEWPADHYSSVAQQACEQVEQIWREWRKSFEQVCREHFI